MHRLQRSTRPLVRLAVVLLGAATLPVAAAGEGMDPFQVARLRQVSSVSVSPDGRHVAYVLSVPRDPFEEDNGASWAELHLIDGENRSRPFVTGQINVGSVTWTPDGRGIAFLAKRGSDEHKSLYVIPVDGGEARRVLEHETDIEAYSLAPDGKRVAFLAQPEQDEKRKELEEQGFNPEVFEEAWRPVRVWISELDAGDDAEPRMLKLEGSAADLHWSPAGDRLLLTLAPTPLIDDHYMHRRLSVVDVKSGQPTVSAANPGKLGQVAWSPSGAHVAIISGVDIHDPQEGRLMVFAAGDGALRDLTPNYPGHVESFAWLDANAIAFVGDEGTTTRLARTDLAGNRTTLVRTGGPVLSGVSLSRDGKRAAFRGETPQHPAEVFRMTVGSGQPERVTDSNPWLADVELARQEVVTFRARDGLELEGILVHPLGAQRDKRYPLVMIVHGGPESHHRNGWQTSYSRPAQVLAARGFAVFFTNYRGSTGRGVEFSKLSQADFAGKEFDDLVDAVDHLVERGLVDRAKVGVTGGSYGGYATAWCSTYYSDRFAAGVMFVGISDLFSKVGTSDIPNELYQVHMRKFPWDDWKMYLERSPIRHLDKARTPLLIMHGKEDSRVFPGQSMELYRYLKIRNQAPVRLVFYPGEGHGNRKAAARLDYSLRLLRWMEHYLTGAGGAPPPYEIDDYGAPAEDDEQGQTEDRG